MTRYDKDARPDDDARSGISENALGEMITPLEAVIDAGSTRKLHREAERTQEIIAERRKRAAEPVQMAGLKPLPDALKKPGTSAGMIPGGPEALGMVPRMARTIPAPYQRPRIAIDHHGKTWAYAPAETVEPGDIVVDFGKVEMVDQQVVHGLVGDYVPKLDWDVAPYLLQGATPDDPALVAVGVVVVVRNVAGVVREFEPGQQIRVFRVHDQ